MNKKISGVRTKLTAVWRCGRAWIYEPTKTSQKIARGFVEGEEKIYYDKTLLYRGVYHGGVTEDKRSLKKWAEKLKPSSEIAKEIKFY